MPNKDELERHWKERLQNAKLELEHARDDLLAIKDQFSSGIDGPDGGYAYRQAICKETAALIEYSRVLRIYTDLAVHGKVPEEGDGN